MTRIVICIDGTGNEIGDRNTNVLKLYRALDKDDPDQQAHYLINVVGQLDTCGGDGQTVRSYGFFHIGIQDVFLRQQSQ